MMLIRVALLIVLYVISLSACQSLPDAVRSGRQPVSTTPSMTAIPSPLPVLPNFLVFTNARVEARRKDSLISVPVALGTELQPGDVLTVTEGLAAIFCGAESDWAASPLPLTPAKPAGIPCGTGRPPRPYPDAAIVRARSGEVAAANEIQILSPRTGWVLTDRPALVWTEITGANSYTVTLESDDAITRTIVASGSPLPYPQAWESLQAMGASYRLVVEAGDKTSGDKTPGFSLLEDLAGFEVKVQRLQQRPLADPARTLLLAELYLSYNLRSEAVDLLTALPNADTVIAVQSLLGETYLNMGLVAQGQIAYNRMAQLAAAQGFIESQAQALTGLGFAACAVSNLKAVRAHWSQARELYDQNGLTVQAETVKSLIVEIEKRCS